MKLLACRLFGAAVTAAFVTAAFVTAAFVTAATAQSPSASYDAAAVWAAAAPAYDLRYPDDARLVDVRNFGAVGDGVADDTEAIQAAIEWSFENSPSRYHSFAMVYLPAGTYRVTDQIESRIRSGIGGWSDGWRSGMVLVGESMENTVIQLADNAPGYGDPGAGRAVIKTGSEKDSPTQHPDGGGNRAFNHVILNLTVDTGSGNPGAYGIDYVTSNRGAVEHVTIRSGDGQGLVGLRMERNWPGPGLVKFLRVEGFDLGISVRHYEYSMTFEHVWLAGQNAFGVDVRHNSLFMRGVRSENAVPAFRMREGHSLLVLAEAALVGGSGAAIEAWGKVLLRDVAVEGYAKALDDRSSANADVAGSIDEHASDLVRLFDDAPATTLGLRVRETPMYHTADFSRWANVEDFGATSEDGSDDDGPAIQAAIDSGAEVVYLPNGSYSTGQTLVLRGNLRKLTGVTSQLNAKGSLGGAPILRLAEGNAEAVVVEFIRFGGTADGVQHDASRALSLRHVHIEGRQSGGAVTHPAYHNTAAGTGDVFIEDAIARYVHVDHPQRLFARQLNAEFDGPPLVRNRGGTLWLLGFKTEGEPKVVESVGGRLEALGVLARLFQDGEADEPMFDLDGTEATIVFAENYRRYPVKVRERRGDDVRDLTADGISAQTNRGPRERVAFYSAAGAPAAGLAVEARALLQGPYAADAAMRELGSELPAVHPFGAAEHAGTPLAYDGDELYGGSAAGITGWVLVELRAAASGPPVARQAALLRADGAVVSATDGASPVRFDGVDAGSYYVAVRHRSHLAAMTPAAVALPGVADLTGGVYGAGGAAEVEPGVLALWAGDLNGDGMVTALDFNAFSAASSALSGGYHRADLNGDGAVTALDFNAFSAASAAIARSAVPE